MVACAGSNADVDAEGDEIDDGGTSGAKESANKGFWLSGAATTSGSSNGSVAG